MNKQVKVLSYIEIAEKEFQESKKYINELEKMGVIKKINKKIIIDRNTWPNIKPEDSIKRMSNFLSNLSNFSFFPKFKNNSLLKKSKR